jgi:hypothetical protein
VNHETEIRARLAKLYVVISNCEVSPELMQAAEKKLSEAIGILEGRIPVAVETREREKAHG